MKAICFSRFVGVFFVVLAVLGCERIDDAGSKSLIKKESTDYEYRVKEAQLNQDSVLRAKAQFERWAAKPELRKDLFPDSTLVPYDLKASKLPEFEIPKSTISTIEKVIQLVESEQFSREDFAKKLNLEFKKEPSHEIIRNGFRQKVWSARSKDGKIERDCKVGDGSTIEIIQHKYESDGSEPKPPNDGSIKFGEVTSENGKIEFFTFALPAVDVADEYYRTTREGHMYERLFPILYHNDILPYSLDTPGRAYKDVPIVQIPDRAWYITQRQGFLNWLSWVYTERIDRLTSNRPNWYAITSDAGQLATQPIAKQLPMQARDGTIWPFAANRFAFQPLGEIRGAVEALGTRVFLGHRMHQFVGKQASYKVSVEDSGVNAKRLKKLELAQTDTMTSMLVRCVKVVVERHVTNAGIDRRAFNPESIAELEAALLHFSPILNSKSEKLPFNLIIENYSGGSSYEDAIFFSLHRILGAHSQVSNHAIQSNVVPKVTPCNFDRSKPSRFDPAISCYPDSPYGVVNLIPAFLDGPKCITVDSLSSLLVDIRTRQEKIVGVNSLVVNEVLELNDIVVDFWPGAGSWLRGLPKINRNFTNVFWFESKDRDRKWNLIDAKIGVIASNDCVAAIQILPLKLNKQIAEKLKEKHVK